jgi:hypothetical protein
VSWHLLRWAKGELGAQKKKQKIDEEDGADGVGDVTPPRRDEGDEAHRRRSLRDPAVRARHVELVTANLTQEHRNSIIFGMYTQAQKKLDKEKRERFSKKEIGPLLEQMRGATGEAELTWNAAQRRVARILGKDTVERQSGSGRKTTFTPAVEEKAIEVFRSYGGDVSRSHVYDVVKAEIGSPFVPSRSVFLDHLNKGNFKRKRVRYRPKLTEVHMEKRVAFAKAQLQAPAAKEGRIVFVDEKRFEATSAGVLTLPVGDVTPKRSVQSKTNPVFVMVLVGVMKPEGNFDGVVGMHAFVERVAAGRNSKNREKGTIELKAFNVNGETYIGAWEKDIFPKLKKLIEKGKIEPATNDNPLYLQDDNARPHRAVIDDKKVAEHICDIGRKTFNIHVVPLDPCQPPQSPDTNPLDTFVFRLMNIRFRRARAQSRVKASAEGLRRPVQQDVGAVEDVVELLSQEEEFDDDEARDEIIHRRRGIPLRCAPPKEGLTKGGRERQAKCGGCMGTVKERDVATVCDMRNGWWHNACAQECLKDERYERATDPALVGEDERWVCPQCMHHLCRNDDRTLDQCVFCHKKSARSGADMGTDMIACDSRWGGLFHKSCVLYDEGDEIDNERDTWFCPACDLMEEDEDEAKEDGLEQIEECMLHENSVPGLLASIKQALSEIPRKSFDRGFETRRVFMEKIIEAQGKNDYNMHYRGERKRKEREAREAEGGNVRRRNKR